MEPSKHANLNAGLRYNVVWALSRRLKIENGDVLNRSSVNVLVKSIT